ncbi:MAG: hypothetical protein V3U65_10585 [Granulosicoccaceae bacterium]
MASDQKNSNGTQLSAMRPSALLDNEAAAAWQAYNAMETTKSRHYTLLEIIDNKKKNYNIDSSDTDKQMLQFLLDDHSAQVKSFTEASKRLKNTNEAGHKRLFDYIGLISTHQGLGEKPH